MVQKHISEILEGTPNNWGQWENDDEIGAINFLGPKQAIRATQAVESGKSFTLGLPICDPRGDFKVPTRINPQHHMERDKGHYEAGKAGSGEPTGTLESVYRTENAVKAYGSKAGVESADDSIYMQLHTPTHIDALGHCWYDNKLYNNVDAKTTKGGLDHGSIEPVGNHGIVGRGILLDIPRYRGTDFLSSGSQITLDELLDCATEQGTEIEKRDIILIRTGVIERYYAEGSESIDYYDEPGITVTEDILKWFDKYEISLLGSDTIRCEQTISDETDTFLSLHAAFLRNLGIPLNELLKLDKLAKDCNNDDKYNFLFTASPLKIRNATASPINPLVVK